jgi:hypothetical protein
LYSWGRARSRCGGGGVQPAGEAGKSMEHPLYAAAIRRTACPGVRCLETPRAGDCLAPGGMRLR